MVCCYRYNKCIKKYILKMWVYITFTMNDTYVFRYDRNLRLCKKSSGGGFTWKWKYWAIFPNSWVCVKVGERPVYSITSKCDLYFYLCLLVIRITLLLSIISQAQMLEYTLRILNTLNKFLFLFLFNYTPATVHVHIYHLVLICT